MDFAPDAPIRTPDILTDVSNFVPDVSGNYVTSPVMCNAGGFNGNTLAGTSEPVLGAAVFRNLGDTLNCAFYGTTQRLFGSADTSVGSASYSISSNASWCFAAFGNAVLAANGKSKIQAASDMTSPSFSDISQAPTAKIIFEHQNAIVALNTSNDDGWACSDTGDYTTWTPAAGNFADAGNLRGGIGGPLTAGTTWDKFAVAFKPNATYIGERVEEIDQAIHWERLTDFVGCPAIHGWAKTENGLIFVSQNDILIYDGSRPRSIADAKVRRAFNRRVPYYRSRVFITHDDIEKNVYFWHNSAPQVDAWADSAFVYNYKSGKWGKVDTIQTNGTSYVQARCPIVGVQSTNYFANTIDTAGNSGQFNTAGSNHLILHNSTTSVRGIMWYRATNSGFSAYTRATAGKPSFTTGYIGQHDIDSTLSRFWIVTESFDYNTSGSATGSNVLPESATVYTIREDLSSSSETASVNAMGMIDITRPGRYFQVKPTWPTSIHRQTISIATADPSRQLKGR